jgi:hypothetical protein
VGAPAGGAVGVEADGGVAGAVAGDFCCVPDFCLSSTEVAVPAFRVATIASERDVNMNTAAAIVVAFESTVAAPRGPNAVCDPIPPKAPARSAALPLWRSTTMTRNRQTTT